MTKSVFVTGADGGLGYAFTKQFLAEGWRVCAGAFMTESPLRELAEKEDLLTTVPLDVSDMASVTRAASAVADQVDSLDLLINNAGINPDKEIVLEELDIDLSRQAIEVNALGPLRVTQQFLSLLDKGTLKRIVNVSSEAGSITNCYRTSWYGYGMSKAALNMQTRILQNYLGQRGFTVMCVHPGWMRSGMGAAEATYAPEETAASMYPLITGPRGDDAPQFFQWDGEGLPW